MIPVPPKLIVGGIVLIVVLAAGATIWWHYKGLLEENKQLAVNQAQLETAVDLKDQEIAVMQDQGVQRRARAHQEAQELWSARAEVSALEEKLAKHDLAVMVRRHPETMTKIFNRGTERALQETEDAANAILGN